MSLNDRLAAAPPVPHSRDCHQCWPPEGRPGIWVSASVGALAGAVVALFVLLGGAW
jgi:hypothetical protein